MTRFFTIVIFVLQFALVGQVFSQSNLWTEILPVDNRQAQSRTSNMPLMPSRFRLLALNEPLLTATLHPSNVQRSIGIQLDVPLPNGEMTTVVIVESAVLPPDLASKYPDIKTYRIKDTAGVILSGRVDQTPQGFHAMLDTEQGTVFIDPRENGSERVYISYYKSDYQPIEKTSEPRSCGVDEAFIQAQGRTQSRSLSPTTANRSGDQLRTYKLAVAATGEYTAFHGGTVPDGLAAITTTINRVNQIYNRDLSVQLELVANNDLLIYTDGGTDPYTNNNGDAMLVENIANLDTVIGNSNYDVGHVLSTNGGGVAFLGVICDSLQKGGGVTGTINPINDPFDIDFVAHEIGHQFSGNHIFNGVNNACSGGNRNGSTAVEPGSGSTIQGYAGICGTDDLQSNTDAMFSTQSIDEMVAHTVTGGGNACAAVTSNGNTAPNVDAGLDYTIPARTPFEMTGSATDAEPGDTLTYSWEQFDLGPAQAVNAGDNGSSPLFRVFLPTVSPTRSFPKLDSILNNTSTVGETLPTMSRAALNLRLTVRDQQGGVDKDTAVLTVEDTGQGFEITSQNSATTLLPGSSVDINWNVAGTTAVPISCANVDVLMSVDGGQSFPTILASSVPNDGSQSVTLPNNPETQVRFKVKCSNNIFFDINNADIVIDVVPVFLTYEDVPSTPLVIDNASTSCIGTPITRTINVTDAVTVNNMAFGFTADHSYRGDIQVSIMSPNLTTATVIASTNDGDDNYDVSLDDSQTLPLDNNANDITASPFYDRGAAPSNPLSVFNGENASGDWTISVCDTFSVDDGLYYRSALIFPVNDFDNDGIPDITDPDDDNDGVLDTSDSCLTADYNISADNDSDGCDDADEDLDDDNDSMPDEWEIFYDLDPLLDFDAQLDGDNDQLTNLDEFTQGTDPTKPNANIVDIQNEVVKRSEIAKRILLKIYGLAYIPPAATGVYTDVQAADFNARWIEQLVADGITEGCATDHYCPDMIVTKGQLSKILLKSIFGSAFVPNPATVFPFTDVTPSTFSADWIEELLNQGFTDGCDADNFCPNEAVTIEGFNTMLNKVFP